MNVINLRKENLENLVQEQKNQYQLSTGETTQETKDRYSRMGAYIGPIATTIGLVGATYGVSEILELSDMFKNTAMAVSFVFGLQLGSKLGASIGEGVAYRRIKKVLDL